MESCEQLPPELKLELMQMALQQARIGLDKQEIPVGCIFVEIQSDNSYIVVAKSHNLTNITKNASMHCEIACINSLEDKNIDFKKLIVFVTVEPCIMCAYALNLKNIKKVYFGCKNERFGGNGSIISLQNFAPNSYPVEGGILEQQAISLLTQCYEKGNPNLDLEDQHRNKRLKKI